MPRITPNLWFDTESMEAAEFYVSVFPNSKITNVSHYGEAGPREAGTVLTVDFELDGQRYTAINGGPRVHVRRGDLAADRLRRPGRDRLLLEQALRGRRGGPVRLAQGPLRAVLAGRAGRRWPSCCNDPDQGRAQRAMQAMLGMKKIDVAALYAAADGALNRSPAPSGRRRTARPGARRRRGSPCRRRSRGRSGAASGRARRRASRPARRSPRPRREDACPLMTANSSSCPSVPCSVSSRSSCSIDHLLAGIRGDAVDAEGLDVEMPPHEVERTVGDVLVLGVDVGQAGDVGQADGGKGGGARIAHAADSASPGRRKPRSARGCAGAPIPRSPQAS